MAYRASATPPTTRWARHLDKVLRERNWSRVKMFEEIGAELGYRPKSRSAFLPLLADVEPDEVQAAVLRKHFGDPPPEPEPQMTEPPADLAEVLLLIRDELREVREDRDRERERYEARLLAVEAELESLRAQRGGGARSGQSVPLGTAG